MRNRSTQNLKRAQQSISWYDTPETLADPGRGATPDYYEHLNTHMLIDDLRNSVIPIAGYTRKPFDVTLVPPDEAAEELISEAIDRRGYSHDLAGAVCDFIQMCAGTLLTFTEAYYEIGYFLDDEGKKVAFYLSPVPPRSIVIEGTQIKQYVPAIIARERGLQGQHVTLSPETIMAFSLPEYVRADFPEMLRFLAQQSARLLPKFAMQNLENPSKRVPFDSDKYWRAQKMALAAVTKDIGYNFRDYNMQYVTEYYYWHRDLMFENFKVELRESILDVLNGGIARAGKELGFACQIKVEGLPNKNDIKTAQEKLAAGEGSFEAILKPFRYH